jgi:hypothetical protein
MRYFSAGLWHASAAVAFAAAFGVFGRGDAMGWLRDPIFCLALVPSSCALFPVPDAWAKKGLWKFLHYPLPDWDVLLLSPASHRFWLSHSAALPLSLCWAQWRYPQWAASQEWWPSVASGLCVGIGSHLFWDCVGSRTHRIVVVPHWWHLRSAASRIWLLGGALTSLLVAARISGLEQAARSMALRYLNSG